jgi:hypothetical protein
MTLNYKQSVHCAVQGQREKQLRSSVSEGQMKSVTQQQQK